jgi:hypothetical protein
MENRPLYPLALYLANERREREYREAELVRMVARKPRRPLRQAVGQVLVRAGVRLAGEVPLELARLN